MHRLLVRGILVCATCLPVLAPRLAPALGLGAIEARSTLHEPLEARIPLTRVRGGDLEGMRVALGTPTQFELAGVARLEVLERLRFTVVAQDGQRDYIRVWTDQPITEPALTFLVEADWPRGRTVRGYRLRLAAAVGGAAAGGADAADAAATEAERGPEAGAPGSEAAGGSDSAPAVSPASSGARYGPVRASDTLWSIAKRVRPDASVSVQRMMLALLEANPEAFAIGNVNALNAGATLRIPSRSEIGPDDRTAAIAEVKRQQAAWTQHREGVLAAPSPPTPAPAPSAPAAPAPPREVAPEPGGRAEAVSPDTTPEAPAEAAERAEDAELRSLRDQLALAIEEADAARRENEALKLRLAEVEDHVEELSRLVDLKSEEIAALQGELRARAQSKPAPTPPEAESEPAPAPAEAQPKPAPFGLGALPVNPVFLVGGAGLFLILLGVVALLRRRASVAAGDDEALDSPRPPPRNEDNLLQELEAMAADLAAESERIRPVKPGADAGRPGIASRLTPDRRKNAPLAAPSGGASGGPGPGAADRAKPGAGRPATAADGRARARQGTGDPRATPRTGLDGPAGPGRTGAPSLEDFAEGEVQTKLDIAKVYVEMGDTDSARGYLKAVLAEGDPGQRNVAREMLSRLT